MKRRWIFLLPALRKARNSLESDLVRLKHYIERASNHEPAFAETTHAQTPPDELPIYRLLTGKDDAEFCHRVSAAVALGYRLYGNPVITSVDARVIVGQAVLWPGSSSIRPDCLD
jgi:hypothetical protein